MAVDTFFAGTLKGVGKLYIQTVLECQPLRLGPALHLEDADHGRSDPEQPRAALLRGGRYPEGVPDREEPAGKEVKTAA